MLEFHRSELRHGQIARMAPVPFLTKQRDEMTGLLGRQRGRLGLLRWIGRALVIATVLFLMPVGCMVAVHYGSDGSSRDRGSRHASTSQAPPAETGTAVIQVYAARAARWRGAFGVHTWFAVKPSDATRYYRIEVIGYQAYWGRNAVRIRGGTPDSMWFGNYPTLLREITGTGDSAARVDAMIERVVEASESYRYSHDYHVWPGPNSNTFIATLGREIPELRLELPPNAIGKDYLPGGAFVALTPSKTGLQLSLRGLLGVMASLEEGLEFNLLGLTAGVDVWPPALKLPGIGRIGFSDTRRYQWQ